MSAQAMAEPNYEAERKLPAGLTCADCRHGARCDALFGAIRRGFTSCDFWPSRFAALTPSADDTAERVRELEAALKLAVDHLKHMGRWVGDKQLAGKISGYSFEALGEDLPGIEAALNRSTTDGK